MPRKPKGTDGGLSDPSRVESKPIDTGGGTPSGDNEPQGGNPQPQSAVNDAADSRGFGPIIIDPAGAPDPGDSGEPRRRGRPPGSTNKAKVSPDLSKLDGILKGGALLIGRLLDDQEGWELTDKESAYLSETYTKLVSLYVIKMDPKKVAWGEAGIATAVVLGPRIVRSMKGRPKPEIVYRTPVPAATTEPPSKEDRERPGLTPIALWPQSGGSDGGPV